MPFNYFKPCDALTPYIKSYWVFYGEEKKCDVLHPDGCVDVIANLGDRFCATQKDVALESNTIYLGGALTETIYGPIPSNIYQLGVRFQPGRFSYFYSSSYNLSGIKNNCIPVRDTFLPPLHKLKQNPVPILNSFFYKKLNKKFNNPLKNAITAIKRVSGNITLNEIASKCYKSPRQTERLFKQHVGLSPKQFCRIIKFVRLQESLETKRDETLLEIALKTGYYDHAHLTKEYKRITNRKPSDQ